VRKTQIAGVVISCVVPTLVLAVGVQLWFMVAPTAAFHWLDGTRGTIFYFVIYAFLIVMTAIWVIPRYTKWEPQD
jgi:hypothetical protein